MHLPGKTALIACVYLCWPVIPGFANTTDPLLQAIHQRLALMQNVAAYKWLHSLPIEDSQREAIVVNAARQGALRQGIEPQSSKQFFFAQISAAKEIQEYWFEKWEAGNAPLSAPDLTTEIRPRLIQLGDEILLQLHSSNSLYGDSSAGLLAVEGLTRNTRLALLDALKNIRLYPDRLTQIMDTGQLRIGTTGDYAPFSTRLDARADTRADTGTETNTGPVFSGIDIQLAHNLANYLNAEAVFVATTWPTLMADLKAGLFDIAMSGVSRTPQRETVAFFSHAYLSGGKTPIVRCNDTDQFNSLQSIDQTGVRIIVNPGGTNERFVKANIHTAQVEVFDNNVSIFSKIILGDADVMITDRIEVTHQSNLHPELCAAMKTNLTHQEKAYLLPRDKDLQARVNMWLDLRISEGVVAKIFDKALH